MPVNLTCPQIAMLCDIGEFEAAKLSEGQKQDLQNLVAQRLIEPANDDNAAYQMTALGLAFLQGRVLEAAE